MDQTKKSKILYLLDDISRMAKRAEELISDKVVNITDGVLPTITTDVLYGYYETDSIPLPYLEWLSICNGISGRCINTLHGIEKINELLNLFPYWALKKWFPIADDGCGDYYVIVPTNINNKTYYPVVFLDHEHAQSVDVCDQITCVVSSDFELFLTFFLEEILFTIDIMFIKGYAEKFDEDVPSFWWPFDRETVLEKDPDIVLFNLPLPWEV
jgi:hypothetical protein